MQDKLRIVEIPHFLPKSDTGYEGVIGLSERLLIDEPFLMGRRKIDTRVQRYILIDTASVNGYIGFMNKYRALFPDDVNLLGLPMNDVVLSDSQFVEYSIKGAEAVFGMGGEHPGSLFGNTEFSGAALYNGENIRRDKLNFVMQSIAQAQGIPRIGVCRDFEIELLLAGIPLRPTSDMHHPPKPSDGFVHHIVKGGYIDEIVIPTILNPCNGLRVPSLHNVGVHENDINRSLLIERGLRIWQKAPDGFIEGVIGPKVLKVQYHPEADPLLTIGFKQLVGDMLNQRRRHF